MSKRFRICLAVWIAVVIASACTNSLQAQTNQLPTDLNLPVASGASPQVLTPVPQPEIIPAPVASSPQPPVAIVDDSDWHIEIIPARKVSRAVPVANDGDCENCASQFDPTAYKRIYDSIPFSRAQFDANPNYRHDSTMEILTGNARHQTIIRHSTVPRRPATARPVAAGPSLGNPYQYGYLRPALRLNYYRHFPSLNPYLNVWNLSGAF